MRDHERSTRGLALNLYRIEEPGGIHADGQDPEGLSRTAYRYGYRFAHDPSCPGADWDRSHRSLRQRWESRFPGTWDRFMHAVRNGFEQGAEAKRDGQFRMF
jgi:hypothetical protein